MSFSGLYVDQEIEALTPYKYLDSLDTVRFRDFASAQINGAQLHAYADFFLSMLMGEGIVVPNNQLIDSLAFLDVAAQLIQYAQRTGRLQYLSLRASLFNSSNPYEVASTNFGKIGTEEKEHADRYVLSGWPHLDTDYPRRSKWKEQLALGESIPTTSEFCHPNEIPFVEKLNIILRYFSSDGKKHISTARPNKQVRIDEIHQVADLGAGELEELLSDLDTKTSQVLIDIIAVINKLRRHIQDIDIRSNIVNALALPGIPVKLNPLYFERTAYPAETHRGVLAIVDSIYNYASGFGVRADLISHTARANAQDTETPSFYALALWARLTNKREKNFVLNTPNGLIVPSGIQWNRILERRGVMDYIARNNFPWDVILEATTDPAWRLSLDEYLKALYEYHHSDAAHARDAEKKYLEERHRHLVQSRHRIPKEYLDIRDEEIRIKVENLDKQIEETVTSTEEHGREVSRIKHQEAGMTAAVEAKAGAEAGLTPKLSAEISSRLEGTVNISNERQEKQSRMLQGQRTTKASRDIVFALKRVEKLYEIEKANAVAIKGVIAAIEESLA